MRLLLTGAQGFTGLYVAAAATRAGYGVVALGCDLTDVQAVRASVLDAAPTHVIHLAAISAVTHDDALAFYRVNLFGTLNLLDALCALDAAPLRVVLASSANVYGNCESSPIDEATRPAPVNHYAMSKLAMEDLSRAQFGEKLPLVITRPFNYTGVGHDRRFVVPKLVHHFASRAPRVELGNLDVEREFNDVRPVAETYVRLLAAGAPGETYNLCSGRPVSLRTVIGRLGELSHHTIEATVNPAFVRSNEIFRLTGDPAKLHAAIGASGANGEVGADCAKGAIAAIELDATLAWMLEAARSPESAQPLEAAPPGR